MLSMTRKIARRELMLLGLTLPAAARVLRAQTPPPAAAQRLTDSALKELLPAWPDASRAILFGALSAPDWSGRIDPQTVQALTAAQATGVDELLIALLPLARHYSRPPVSDFHVGSVVRGASGAFYPGANLEIPRSALNQTVHAEQAAVANAFAHDEGGIAALAGSEAPCGHCRQFLNEITGGGKSRVLIAGSPAQTLDSLLPAAFGPADLGLKTGLFGTPPAALRLSNGDALTQRAVAAASRSYAPHTKSPSGCAVETTAGAVYAGSYIENAAYNPSLGPLHSALVQMMLRGEDFGAIRRAVLVEANGAAISQKASVQAVLDVVAPATRLEMAVAQS